MLYHHSVIVTLPYSSALCYDICLMWEKADANADPSLDTLFVQVQFLCSQTTTSQAKAWKDITLQLPTGYLYK